MTTLPEIEVAIQQLPAGDIRRLSAWLQEYLAERWDQQIQFDLESGKLDNLIAEAEADILANRVRELDEFLHNP